MTYWWELEVWLPDITCLCVTVDLGAVKFDVCVRLMAHVVLGNHNQLDAQHGCQNAPQCPLSPINCFSLYQRTCSILIQCGNVVEQTQFFITSSFGYIDDNE